MSKIGIVGYGIVGEATEYSFKKRNPNHEFIIYDKFKPGYSTLKQVSEADFIFICLPTPSGPKGIDLSIIDKNIQEIVSYNPSKETVIIIKSTVIPGTTRNYKEKYPNLRFCFNPEFLTEKNYLQEASGPDRVVIGTDNNKTSLKVNDLYREDFPDTPIFLTDTITAEMVKYTANCFLATKVMFGNEIYDICQSLDINYEEVKKMVVADRRISKTHLDVTSVRGFGGKCFPKDIQAMIKFGEDKGVNVDILKTVWNKNLNTRKIRDWEEIPGTTLENKENFDNQ